MIQYDNEQIIKKINNQEKEIIKLKNQITKLKLSLEKLDKKNKLYSSAKSSTLDLGRSSRQLWRLLEKNLFK